MDRAALPPTVLLDALDRAEDAAELLVHRLTVVALLVRAGESDHLAAAVREAEVAAQRLRVAELLRCVAVDGLVGGSGAFGSDPSLRELAAELPPAERGLVLRAGDRLAALVAEVDGLRAEIVPVLRAELDRHRVAVRSLPHRWEGAGYVPHAAAV